MTTGGCEAHCDAAIVGLGPVGITLANLLAAGGMLPLILERTLMPHPAMNR